MTDDDTTGAGRREPAAEGEAVADVPVLRRLPTETEALITIDAPEATAWCPYEGTADYYELRLTYQPDDYALELMSYRDYLQTYRDETVGHEAFANRVYEDLVTVIEPRWLRLEVDAPPRYGLEMTLRHQTAAKPAGLRDVAAKTD